MEPPAPPENNRGRADSQVDRRLDRHADHQVDREVDRDDVGREFERHRGRLRGLAYRLLGSMTDADDAVQECWLRLDRHPPEDLSDLGPWLSTVLARICLDMLRSRRSRREDYTDSWLPSPLVAEIGLAPAPDEAAILAESVGVALLVVLEALSPPERLAFVLHDVFALPFDEIAPIVGRSAVATRQLASRARRRVQAARAEPDASLESQRAVVEAFLAASRAGDIEGVMAVLAPDAVLRIDAGDQTEYARPPVTGAAEVADVVRVEGPRYMPLCRVALVNGEVGLIVGSVEHPVAVIAMAVRSGRIREIDLVLDRAKLGTGLARRGTRHGEAESGA